MKMENVTEKADKELPFQHFSRKIPYSSVLSALLER